ncbi:hypothetical protein AB0B94_31110 [Micromonospora sp. NPDC048986]|uniref:zinc finger domain-containing protein n=1 Tax=Micromonospora sp. NPDC048986 TaxID=3155644 RepID=UPI0033C587DD
MTTTADPADSSTVDHVAARTNAAEAAKQAYLDAHPEPENISFPCPRCKAPAGQPCVWPTRRQPPGGRYHAQRMDKMIRAFNDRQYQSVLAFDAAYDEYSDRYGLDT